MISPLLKTPGQAVNKLWKKYPLLRLDKCIY